MQVAPAAVQREIFDILSTFYKENETPEQWRTIILFLVQKDMSKLPLPANFRPIGLLEVLRKVWTKMIFKRIKPMLVAGDVLQHNHCAFLPRKGTASELIQLLNVLEEVVEHDLDVDLSTSDVKGAFDSPERTAQYACWTRVGIPKELTTYLVCLGALDNYKMATPYGLGKNFFPLLI
jgi:hypothetical protein